MRLIVTCGKLIKKCLKQLPRSRMHCDITGILREPEPSFDKLYELLKDAHDSAERDDFVAIVKTDMRLRKKAMALLQEVVEKIGAGQ